MILVTTDNVPGKTIKEVKGLVNGTSVQTKSAFSDMGAGLKSLVGGKLSKYEEMCMTAQQEAVNKIVKFAESIGANAVVGIRFATPNTTMAGSAEIVAYGTAVVVE